MKSGSDVDGAITGVRSFKRTDVGRLRTSTGQLLAQSPFSNESAYTKDPLRALSNSETSGNGAHRYGAGGMVPSGTYRSATYWVIRL